MRRRQFLWVVLAAVGLFCFGVSGALADDCASLGGNIVGTECVIDGTAPGLPPNTHSGSFTLNETLRMTGTGIITVPAAPASITIDITSGDFVMENGTKIIGDYACPSDGPDITITVDSGNVNMKPGSLIRSEGCSG